MDTFLGILSVALAIAGLVPAFTARQPKRRILFVFLAASLVLVVATQWWNATVERHRTEQTRRDIGLLFSSNNPMSFEQILENLNHIDYSIATSAVEELVAVGDIHSATVNVTSSSGHKYVVRVYNTINFPIPP